MIATGAVVTLSPRDFDAVLFDLDGVLTPTASVHAAAWKRLFDDALRQHAAVTGEPFVPFDIDADYRRYVDGKPRCDGVRAFLESRGIELPEGDPDEPPGTLSLHALASLKDQYFLEQLQSEGVEPYESSTALVELPTRATSGDWAWASAWVKVTREPWNAPVDALEMLCAVTSSAADCATAPAVAM